MYTCYRCREEVQYHARKCPHCHSDLDPGGFNPNGPFPAFGLGGFVLFAIFGLIIFFPDSTVTHVMMWVFEVINFIAGKAWDALMTLFSLL